MLEPISEGIICSSKLSVDIPGCEMGMEDKLLFVIGSLKGMESNFCDI